MQPPSPSVVMKRVRGLPPAGPLRRRLPGDPPVYLVGGSVRDLLMGLRPTDLDLVVEGDAAAVAQALGGEARAHDRFGTMRLTLDGFTYDLARSRREAYERPGALPDVEPADLEVDLLRRDFTVNAMAIALNGPRPGELRAAPQALDDLEARRLRVLHEHSFIDDPTRLLRLARYASRLGFTIETGTLELVDSAVSAGALDTVSGARLGAEVRLLAREVDSVAALEAMAQLGLDRAVDPGFGLEDPALARRALALTPADARADVVALALALRRVLEPRRRVLLERLAFEAGEREAILAAAALAEPVAQELARAATPAGIAAAVGGAPPEAVAIAAALGPEEPARAWLERLRGVRLEIGGDDLLAAGIAPGPAVGQGLRAALAAKLDGRVRDRQAELQEAVRAARGS